VVLKKALGPRLNDCVLGVLDYNQLSNCLNFFLFGLSKLDLLFYFIKNPDKSIGMKEFGQLSVNIFDLFRSHDLTIV
jgi:hypothetical protein